jgi:hypothetical protein
VLWLDQNATAAYPTGPTGPQGPQGNQGIQGPTGPTGAGYSRTSTSTATITYNASRTFTLVPDIGAYQVGTRVRVSRLTSGFLNHFMEGRINSVSGNNITFTSDLAVGVTEEESNWSVSVAGEAGVISASSPLTYVASSRAIALSTVTQSNSTGNTSSNIVQGVTVDTYGRVTGVTSGTHTLASTSVAGVASFDNTNFTVSTAGAVSISAVSGTTVSGNISGNAGNVTGVVAIANGGTGATNAASALTALDGAARGANTDITSLGGLTTALSVGQGGTGNTTFSTTGVLLGNGSSAIRVTSPTATTQVLIGTGASGPSWGAVPLANANAVSGTLSISNGGTNATTVALARTSLDLTSTADLLTKFFNYPASGYDVFPRYFASLTSSFTNAMLTFSLFTPLKTTTITSVTTQVGTGRLSYGFSAAYRGIGLYQCSGTNNTTLTPLAATWDKDYYLWATANNAPGTSGTGVTGTATNSGNYTLVTCTGTAATAFQPGQKVTLSGTAGSPGFTSFTGMVVGSPTTSTWIIQAEGTSVVTGTMTGGTATGLATNAQSATITAGTIASGTGTVATVNLTCNTMGVLFTPGQWVNITGSVNSVSGVVSASPAPTATSFTITCPSTLTSGSIGTGTAACPDSYGRYVRPLYTPTASGTGFVTPASITLNAGTTYAVGMMDYQTGGTYSIPSIVVGPSAGINQLHLPYQSLGLALQTGITNANVTGQTSTSTMPWARFT